MPGRVIRHIGNRGLVLALLGVICLIIGAGRIAEPLRRAGLLDEHLPTWVRAAVWLGPGAFAVVAALWRRLDATAWGLLILPFTLGFLLNLLAWVLGDYTGGWRGASLYFAVVLLINRCAAGLDRPTPAAGGK